jgi:hypothetical protein
MPTLTSRRITGLRRSQLADALLERRWRIAAAHRSGAAQDLGAVLALHADRRMRAAILRFGYERPDLVALETRVAIVRGERALREPLRPPERDTQRRELAEVRRPLDRAALEAEFLGGLVVVDRSVIVVLLRGEHLPRDAQRPDQLGAGVLNRRCER